MQDQSTVFLTVSDLSRLLKICRFSLSKYISAGKFPRPDMVVGRAYLWRVDGPVGAILRAQAEAHEAATKALREVVPHE